MKFESAYESALNLNGKELGQYVMRLSKLIDGEAIFNLLDRDTKHGGTLTVNGEGWLINTSTLEVKSRRPSDAMIEKIGALLAL